MQEQLVYLIGNAFRIYIYFKLLNTMFGTAKVKQIWIIIGFTFYFLINSFGAILFGNFTLNILTNIIPLIALSFLWLFCKCWGKRKQRSCEINQMRTAL